MSYRIENDETLEEALRRIAGEQLDKAFDSLAGRSDDPHEAIHDVRKRCKKIRGLLRLARDGLGGTYSRENAALRDAARLLSPLRDAKVRVDTHDALVDSPGTLLEQGGASTVREALVEVRRARVDDADDLERRCEEFASALESVRERSAQWRIEGADADVLATGLRRTYKRASKARRKSRDGGTGEDFHEWRKRAKYHWYHMRLLSPLWPPVVRGRAHAVHAFSSLLGDAHDLYVYRGTLEELRERIDAPAEIDTLQALADHRRAGMEREALETGKPLFKRDPDEMADGAARLWTARRI